jgi:hypothetical protein
MALAFTKGQTIQCPTEKLQQDIQYNDQRKSYKRTENTMTNGKVTKGQTIQCPTEKLQKVLLYLFRWSFIVCPFVTFPMVIVFSVLL